jgi:D-amino-acid dehydrogenase
VDFAPDAPPVAVIGAGIVGVAVALSLRRRGVPVVLIDREGPGAGASHGNGGILARCAFIPVNTPDLWRTAPGMMLSRDGPLFVRGAALPRLMPWLWRFLANATRSRAEAVARQTAPLLLDSLDQHLALAEGTPAARFIRPTDYLYLYRDRAGYEADRFTWTLRRQAGMTWTELDEGALRAREPDLSGVRRFGVALPDHGIITDPGAHVAALAEAFADAGGRIVRASVRAVEPDDGGVTLRTDGADIRAGHAVIAAGAWSDVLARPLGARVRLEAESGYHVDLAGANGGPRHPVMDASRKMVVVPMEGRVRLAGLVEFAGLDAAPARAPTDLLHRGVADLFPALRHDGATPWTGPRPATTDSLPVIGTLPASARVVAAYGHQHVGLTAAARTGRMVADLLTGRPVDIDLAPFRPDRRG